MPLHDWTRVSAGIYHDFHQDWTIEIRRALNGGFCRRGITRWPTSALTARNRTLSRSGWTGLIARVGSLLRKRLPA